MPQQSPYARPDVLVVGGGMAGLMAALAARQQGRSVAVVSLGPVGRSGNTVVAGGVISAATCDAGNTAAAYLGDLLASGQGVADPALTTRLANESEEILLSLERMGVPFLRQGAGFSRVQPPGHSLPRTVPTDWSRVAYAARGMTFLAPLAARAREAGVVFWDGLRVTNLLKQDGRVTGVAARERKTGKRRVLPAGAVILATGGYGGLFRRHNNVSDIHGDGIGMALEAGCTARDMEFVQFYPTMMFSPVKAPISGTMFWAGAVLRNRDGERFMERYDPKGEMARRDAMARAIFLEVRAGRGVDGCVYVDCTNMPEEALQGHFRRYSEMVAKRGINLRKDWLKGSPAVHHTLGGIRIDRDGRTSVPGLFAAGEVCGGVHGVNRIGGAALMEASVFGRAAGIAAADECRSAADVDGFPLASDAANAPGDVAAAGSCESAMRDLRNVLWEHVSLMRDETGLHTALRELARLRAAQDDAGDGGGAFRRTLLVAEAVVRSALARTESRGSHYRADYPETDPAWERPVFCTYADGNITVSV